MNFGMIVSAIVIAILYGLAVKRVGFGTRVFIGMIAGVTVGILFKEQSANIGTIGQVYINLIKMLVMPLVAASIISSITTLSDPGKLKQIGLKTVSLFLVTTAIAASIGLGVALLLDPGSGVQFTANASFKAREVPAFSKVLLDLVPANPVAEMANGKVIPVIVFALFFAVAIIIESAKSPESMRPVKEFINSFTKVMFRVTGLVVRFTPYGVFGLMVTMSGKYGLATLLPLGKVIVAVYIACAVHMLITYGSLVAFVVKVNPLQFLRKIYPVLAVAFTTRSSYATLPVNLEVITKRLKVSGKVASFVAPLGATMNMNGCGGLWPAIVAVFVARVFGIELTIADYFLIVASATIASIGTAGIPGPASISTTVVLASLGLPLEGMAIVLGIDPIVDMARTAVNASGTTVASLVIADNAGEFDRSAYARSEAEELDIA
ncbi:amino acid:proton symporter [Anaerosporomusa subterranea]|uniref:Amino acid:proton symporter n=1 Tax=Anaerosporomusa subterranea TaxID=1794912 RepID=A0A154BMZ3_ANASB|nr:dicarboxylate/amino acid:cation symporter [Anaerosporomusa subterranea]KYZ74888.1 amino acid:proton symporter [Anaerosporomusa subterranea]